MFSNTFQQKNAFDFQFKNQSQQSYRSTDDFFDVDNQYQNRQSFDQRFNFSSQSQRVYFAKNDQKNQYEKVFQNDYYDYNYDYDDEYLSSKDESFEKVFHEHVYHDQQSSIEKINEKLFTIDIIDAFEKSKVKFFFIETSKNNFSCRRCNQKFSFNNKLHYHVKRCKVSFFKSKAFSDFMKVKIIRSSTVKNATSKLDFKFWRYVKLKININSKKFDELIIVCFDFDCESFMIDKQTLVSQRFDYQKHVLRKSKSLKINDINSSSLFINEYIAINFVIFDEIDETSTKVCFTRYVHIINNLKINIFLSNDILDSKNIVIHVDKQKLIVDNCDNFTASLKIIIKNDDDERVKRIIRSQLNHTISTHFCNFIFIKYREFKLSNRDMMFNFHDLKRLKKKKRRVLSFDKCQFLIRTSEKYHRSINNYLQKRAIKRFNRVWRKKLLFD